VATCKKCGGTVKNGQCRRCGPQTGPRRADAPVFKTGDVLWECWATSDGQRYVWRADGDKLLVGREPGQGRYWAKAHGKRLPGSYTTLRQAMMAAVVEAIRW